MRGGDKITAIGGGSLLANRCDVSELGEGPLFSDRDTTKAQTPAPSSKPMQDVPSSQIDILLESQPQGYPELIGHSVGHGSAVHDSFEPESESASVSVAGSGSESPPSTT